ncbi:DNA-directed RNA polymerase subunit beta [Paenibacillus spongiae]|uniref:DNA-directed RNA polymerase subunit beta n=1 Tax=Paenibacillus spongiae TaxID=2909671 RepID=A0ABY5SBM8_9BACL|nr:DNA-directed RNA polymerase subunit beta [Paenibacillus spongiae]UVI29925.1 DNA-directed RNA polymerase subunit beta [Paenibacillus spongiae]
METKKETAAALEGLTAAERTGLQGASSSYKSTGAPQQRKADKEQPGKSEVRVKRNPALRVFLWLLRKSIVPLLCLLAVVGGLYIGFSVIGKQPGSEVFEWSTWRHMYDLVFADS